MVGWIGLLFGRTIHVTRAQNEERKTYAAVNAQGIRKQVMAVLVVPGLAWPARLPARLPLLGEISAKVPQFVVSVMPVLF